jgi:hypothetical protein
MKIKTLIVIVGILAVLSIAVFFLRRPSAAPQQDKRVGQPLVSAAQLDKAARLRLSDAGKSVTLLRQADGSWHVENYHAFPADFSKLSQFVNSLTEANVTRLVSSRPEVVSRLEFKDTRIELADDAGQELWSVVLGKTADTGGRYLRFGAESAAYLASLNAWLDTEPKNWADSQLLSLKAEDIAKIEVPFGGETPVTISRGKATDNWATEKTPEGQRVNASKVSSLLSSVTALRFTDTTEKGDANAAAAKENARTFTLTTFDGKTCRIALGRRPEEKKLKTPAASGGATPDFTKNSPVNPDGTVKPIDPAKPDLPEFETIPAGPVFAFITASDEKARVNELMQKRAFQVAEYVFTGLPQKSAELFEPAPAPTPTPAPSTATDAKPAGTP